MEELPERLPSSPPPRPALPYAPADPPRRLSWLDLAGHATFGVGAALILLGLTGKECNLGGDFGEFLREYYPHMLMVGGFICGTLLSMRIGRFRR